ncbi:hypothetical protein FG379_003076 [Cryptosporidium bovis]|uniref:uncharacterized protein n=1 Tax=Cryptosporidium bovis TaxID=310047 RepID=UPI00351AA1DB|nr:hypothetical protein FG379_003076 [Cryptosporidium bovis]
MFENGSIEMAGSNQLQIKIGNEIEKYLEMHSLLGNILKNIRKNPELFIEISREELENRECNLRRLFDKISDCKDKLSEISLRRKENEFQRRREMNKNYLLASNNSSDYIANENSNISEFNENFSFISEHTNKLQKVALVISKEINEQNRIIEDISSSVENESKFVFVKYLLIRDFFPLNSGSMVNYVFSKMNKTVGISSKLFIHYLQ